MCSARTAGFTRVCRVSVFAICAALPALAQNTGGTPVGGDVGGVTSDDLGRILPNRARLFASGEPQLPGASALWRYPSAHGGLA